MALNDKQRADIIRAARCEAYGKAVLELLHAANAPVDDALNGLTSAVAYLIQVNYPPDQRLLVLNSKLADHIQAWAAEAGCAGTTVQ